MTAGDSLSLLQPVILNAENGLWRLVATSTICRTWYSQDICANQDLELQHLQHADEQHSRVLEWQRLDLSLSIQYWESELTHQKELEGRFD